ncbi:MAG: hypothetical protein WC354_07530 [Candidatus Omnitrophota bacterium]|jgi:Flp pilus assembly pilin Flp
MNKKAQNFSEYALVIGIIAILLFAMQAYFKRGIQGVIKATSDDLGTPAQEAYYNEKKENVSSQFLGARELKMKAYSAEPTTVTRDQEIVVVEKNRGARSTAINKDQTITKANWTVTYNATQQNQFGGQESKDQAGSVSGSAAVSGAVQP